MKTRLPRFFKKFFLFIFIVLLSISFVAYLGGNDSTLTPQAQEIGRIGDHVIKNNRDSNFAKNYQLITSKYQNTPSQIDQEQFNQYMVQEAFIATVIDYLILQENKKNKIVVSDEQVINSIKKAYFQNDEEAFQNFIKSADPKILKRLEKGAKIEALREIYINNLTKSIPVLEEDINNKIEISQIEKNALMAIILKDKVYNQGINEADLKNYFVQNISRYTSSLDTLPPPNQNKKTSDTKNNSVNLNKFLNLSNNQINPLDNSNNNNNTSASHQKNQKQIDKQFLTNRQKVLEDYLLENSENILIKFKEDLEFKIQVINLKKKVSQLDFLKIISDFNFQLIDTESYNYYSQEIKDQKTQTVFIRQPSIIKKLFLVKENQISQLFEEDRFFYLVFNYRQAKKNEVLSDFIKKQFANQMKSKNQQWVIQNYFRYLLDKNQEEIILLGQKLEL